MAVKHIPTDIVHKGFNGGRTGCGVDTRDKPECWMNTSAQVTCEKNGCKN